VKIIINYFLVGLCLLLFVQSHAQTTARATPAVSELYQLATELRADYGSLSRFYHIKNSPERRERFQSFFENYLEKLDDFSFDQLSAGGKVDYLLIKRYLDDQLLEFAKEEDECRSVSDWVDYGETIYALEKLRRRGKKLDGQEVAGSLHKIQDDVKLRLTNLSESKAVLSKALVLRAKAIVQGHRDALGSVFDFYHGYDPDFSWWVEKPYEMLDTLLADYAREIESKVDSLSLPKDDGSGIVGSPIGREELLRQLKHEMISYSPEELVDIATREFAWCDAELLKASGDMGFGDDWKKAQEQVKLSFVPPGQQPEAMLELYDQSIEFLKKHDLLTVPLLAEETWRMKMIPPERQLISPFFLGGEVLQISYPTDEMDHEDKLMSMRGNNPHFSRATVHHELIAGHHLQRYMNNRHKSYRFFYTPFWTEGWALYWEMILWDLGFPSSPEDRIGMLFWRMHRCARIIFSLNYHLGEWTPQQCIDYLVDRVGHERANAEGEVRRSFTGNYGPLYQIAYMVGGLQFYELKKELVDSGTVTFREFHDAVLRENNMPVEMVRAILTNQQLEKNFASSWRFYQR